jgi:hypothetical protein
MLARLRGWGVPAVDRGNGVALKGGRRNIFVGGCRRSCSACLCCEDDNRVGADLAWLS